MGLCVGVGGWAGDVWAAWVGGCVGWVGAGRGGAKGGENGGKEIKGREGVAGRGGGEGDGGGAVRAPATFATSPNGRRSLSAILLIAIAPEAATRL